MALVILFYCLSSRQGRLLCHCLDVAVFIALGSRTFWVVFIDPWRRTPWVVRVLGKGTEGLSGRKLAGQSRQQSASSGLVRRLLNRYRNRILDI